MADNLGLLIMRLLVDGMPSLADRAPGVRLERSAPAIASGARPALAATAASPGPVADPPASIAPAPPGLLERPPF